MSTLDPTHLAEALARKPQIRIRSRRKWSLSHLNELWAYRDLGWFLAMRDVKVRYKQSVLGAAWAIIQPLAMMIVMSTILGRFTGVTDPVYLYAGLLPWTLFATAVTACCQSLVGNAEMLRKVYFPRILVPLSAVGAPLLDYFIAFGVLLILMACYGVAVQAQLLLVPLLALSTVLSVLGVGILIASWTVKYRDFRHVVPFMIQIWFFLTPVIYKQDHLPQWLVQMNPMGGVIQAFRGAILGTPIDYLGWAVSSGVALLALILGLVSFARNERVFADIA